MNEIRDDEFRVIGQGHSPLPKRPQEQTRRSKQIALASFAIVLLLGLAIWYFWPKGETPPENGGIFDPVPTNPITKPAPMPLGKTIDSLQAAFVEKLDTTINDVVLSIYIPHNSQAPILTVGEPDKETRKAIMAFQAADIRADNREILGSFVLKGDIIARGKSKVGFCAIIDGKFYKRYDAKKGKTPPEGAIPCQDAPDPVTGHFPHYSVYPVQESRAG